MNFKPLKFFLKKFKIMKLNYAGLTFVLGVLVTLVFLFLAKVYYSERYHVAGTSRHSLSGVLLEAHEKFLDVRLRNQGLSAGAPEVAILAIDEDSIDLEGRWPWSRAKIGNLLDKTFQYGARTIALDMIFSEEDGNSALPILSKLKREVPDQTKSGQKINQIIESEIKTADSDQYLASIVKKHRANLVMGTYFDGADFITPQKSEICLDSLFRRTPENKYWSKEFNPLIVEDSNLKKIDFPRTSLSAHLSDYFTLLEISRARTYFHKNSELKEKILLHFRQINLNLEADDLPVLTVFALNSDISTLRDLIPQSFTTQGNLDPAQFFIKDLLHEMDRKHLNKLRKALREEGLNYCARFLTPQDELMVFEKYKEYWGESSETQEQFSTFSIEEFWNQERKKYSNFSNKNFDQSVEFLNKTIGENLVPQIMDWELNISMLANSTWHSGYFNALQDLDGTIRRTRLIARHGNNYAPSLALKAFLVSKGYSAKIILESENTKSGKQKTRLLAGVLVQDESGKNIMDIPTDPMGRLLINYAGPQYIFPHVSATQILDPSDSMTVTWRYQDPKTGAWIEDYNYVVNKKDFLKDKILFLGATAIGIYDLRVTPFEANFAGVETHANILSNLLVEHQMKVASDHRVQSGSPKTPLSKKVVDKKRGFLREIENEDFKMILTLLLLGILLTLVLTRVGPLAGLVVVIVNLIIIQLVDQLWLIPNGLVLNILFPIFLTLSLYVVLTFFKYFTEERKKRDLKGVFAKYVSPTIVSEILSNPEGVELGGKKLNLTVFFSDIKGFTNFSEELDPQDLSELLTNYFTPMTQLIFDNKGTLDKYIGDAIMAFWGAPLSFRDHAKCACRCALQMIEKLPQIHELNKAKGFPVFDIRIGLNSGEMSAGNIGSDTVRSYTIMGDGVNLASRLEGVNKEYGTHILLSEYTYVQVKDSFICREIDIVSVAGRSFPLTIFELLGEGSISSNVQSMLEKYQSGLLLYRKQNFLEARQYFELALESLPQDTVCQLYIQRCSDYLESPPPADWDCVVSLSK